MFFWCKSSKGFGVPTAAHVKPRPRPSTQPFSSHAREARGKLPPSSGPGKGGALHLGVGGRLPAEDILLLVRDRSHDACRRNAAAAECSPWPFITGCAPAAAARAGGLCARLANVGSLLGRRVECTQAYRSRTLPAAPRAGHPTPSPHTGSPCTHLPCPGRACSPSARPCRSRGPPCAGWWSGGSAHRCRRRPRRGTCPSS